MNRQKNKKDSSKSIDSVFRNCNNLINNLA